NVESTRAVVLLFSLSMGALGLTEGIFWTTATELGGRARGLACGILNTGGNGGGLIAPVLAPWLAHQYNWGAAISVACLICGLGSVLWLFIVPVEAPPLAEETP